MLILQTAILYLHLLVFVFCQKTYHVCEDIVRPPENINMAENCTLDCGVLLLSDGHQKEIAICSEDSFTPLLCHRNNICSDAFERSTCKEMTCTCGEEIKGKWFITKQPVALRICVDEDCRYLFRFDKVNIIELKSALQIPDQVESENSHVASVSHEILHPKQPLVSFPWRVVLMVFGILGGLALLFIALRWFIPIFRTYQERRNNTRTRTDYSVQGNNLHADQIIPINRDDDNIQTDYSENRSDKSPPPYEAIQILDPPPYEEVEIMHPIKEKKERRNI